MPSYSSLGAEAISSGRCPFRVFEVSMDPDQARLIAARVARRVESSGSHTPTPDARLDVESKSQRSKIKDQSSSLQNGAPVSEELSAIRAGLHDLESKLDRIESALTHSPTQSVEPPRARVIDFLSSGPPAPASPSIGKPPQSNSSRTEYSEPRTFVPATQSPWLAAMSNMYSQSSQASKETNPQSAIRNPQFLPAHPSQERFGVAEAAVSELVEFFENEKKCAVDPSGKPCDHCAMCSGRGF